MTPLYRSVSRIFFVGLLSASVSVFAESEHMGTWGYEVDRVHKQAEQLFESGDYRTSYATYQRLARVGDRYAMYRMAHAHEAGLGVDKSNVNAWVWAKLAADTKVPVFEQNQARIWQKLSESERAEAKELYKELSHDYSEMAIAYKAKKYTDKQLKNITGSRVGYVNPMLKILRDGSTVRGDEYYGEFKETSSELKEYIGKMGTVEVRDESNSVTPEAKENQSEAKEPKEESTSEGK